MGSSNGRFYLDPSFMRIGNITPFTYRDGYTFLQVLEDMRHRDTELIEAINTGLTSLAEDYNKAIAELLSDISAELEQYGALPQQIADALGEARADVQSQFDALAANLAAMIERKLNDDDIDVYNWLSGGVTSIGEYHREEDQWQYDHGLTAGDYSRMGYAVEEFDTLPDIITMATRGREYIKEINIHYSHSPLTGHLVPHHRLIKHMQEMPPFFAGDINLQVSYTMAFVQNFTIVAPE